MERHRHQKPARPLTLQLSPQKVTRLIGIAPPGSLLRRGFTHVAVISKTLSFIAQAY